jgi:GH15 family glucan-1,4-alpha-glucosidase
VAVSTSSCCAPSAGLCPKSGRCTGSYGALDLAESTLDHLEGYAGSSPVRRGNGAYLQRQIDGSGQILDFALMYRALGRKLDRQYRRLLEAVANFIAAHWSEPDQGIWEMRGPPRHHVHSKLMCWVGLDRAARLLGDHWQSGANEIADDIRAHGVSSDDGALQQAYDGGTDAAVLLAPMLGFASPPGALDATIARVRRTLGRGEFIGRYVGEDGLEGEEGAFLVCGSWLIDAELAAGRIDSAHGMLEKLVGCANDDGLYSEEVVPDDGQMLGNFPQALTHLGLIGNVINLQLAQRHGADRLTGSYTDRAHAAVSATFGWRRVLSAMLASRRFPRVFSS